VVTAVAVAVAVAAVAVAAVAVAAVAVAHRRLRGSGPETATRASRKLREPVLRLWLALVGLMC